MQIFDTHCHLDDKIFKDDFFDCLKRAKENNVELMLSVGTNLQSSFYASILSEKYPNIYSSVGIHPHDAKTYNDKVLQELEIIAKKNKKVIAWGEIGLDFNRMFSPQAIQEECFLKQVKLADSLNLPIIFHERDSNGRFLQLLKENTKLKRKGVVHCFSGNEEELKEYLKLGLNIGITGILTIEKKGKELRELVLKIPQDKIVIETDSPYLTPAPHKNKTSRNEPAFLKSVLIKLSEILNEDIEIIGKKVWDNSFKLFLN